MQQNQIKHLLGQLDDGGKKYLEFIRVPALSVGVYRLAPGEKDEQKPHSEDEVYYVVEGRANFWCAGEVQEVRPGSILYVDRGVEHRFIDIAQELVVLVVFGPAEGLNG
jgi:mannose-6-phosphate isomerase-like protein (cupin superfamily)